VADRTRTDDTDGSLWLEKDVGSGRYAKAVVTVDSAGNIITGTGTGAVTIADGSDVAEGAVADAAVLTNATGTISGKLRGLVALNRKGTASAPAAVSVDDTATGTVLLALNANRLVAVIQNLDATNPVYIGKDTTLTVDNGIRIAAGGSFVDDRTTGAWRGCCATGKTADVRVLEVS
jgi:hypothetical protein